MVSPARIAPHQATPSSLTCVAAGNRWLIVPRLQISLAAGEHLIALRRLRLAILTETTLALAVLALVALLGTLSPID